MGWNTLRIRAPRPLLQGLGPEPSVYFVHSYHAAPTGPRTSSPKPTTPALRRDGLAATTSAPASSTPRRASAVGLAMYANFAAMV